MALVNVTLLCWYVVIFTLFVVPRPVMPERSQEEPELAKLTVPKVSVLLPVPDMLMVPMMLFTVAAPTVSEVLFPIRLKVPPLKVNARPATRPLALFPPLLSSASTPPALSVIPEAVLMLPPVPLMVTVPRLIVRAPPKVLVPERFKALP